MNAAAMTHALALATSSAGEGGGPFGAVILNPESGKIIAEGTNRVTADSDPTAHAEVTAIRKACALLDSFTLHGLVMVSSCEPCPMCWGAAQWSRLSRVYFAANARDAASVGFDDRPFWRAVQGNPETAPTPVISLDHPDRMTPFEAWMANAEREAY